MNWLRAVEHLRAARLPGVLVTVTQVRGHAPRAVGAKMVVSAADAWDTIGGGNLEQVAVRQARSLIERGAATPVTHAVALSDKAPFEHGVQCCGGEVELLLEPLTVAPSVAIFGVGHVGLELARILSRHDLDLHLVDSRPEQLTADRLGPLDDSLARIHVHHVPVLPELVLGELPVGSHVLIMTHDHAEDAALCDAALRTRGLASIGLIGSSAKWARFQRKLAAEGHEQDAISSIVSPIGLSDLRGKEPATIAVGVATALLMELERSRERLGTGHVTGSSSAAGRRDGDDGRPHPRRTT
ncbi:Molybdenum cofactor sulfurylase [metagenome]|uniref:Molybdenum cofactor sulfurylase n=1 Tax=metagenome TaxID=256318 RepID=A0A2P2C415_9ZZZZ